MTMRVTRSCTGQRSRTASLQCTVPSCTRPAATPRYATVGSGCLVEACSDRVGRWFFLSPKLSDERSVIAEHTDCPAAQVGAARYEQPASPTRVHAHAKTSPGGLPGGLLPGEIQLRPWSPQAVGILHSLSTQIVQATEQMQHETSDQIARHVSTVGSLLGAQV